MKKEIKEEETKTEAETRDGIKPSAGLSAEGSADGEKAKPKDTGARERAGEKRAAAPRGKNVRRPSRRFFSERPRPEFEQKIINIRRVTRVVSGGRRFSFSVALVAGNKKGKVGVGIGKAGDTALAIDKAMRNAKKNMITLKLDKNSSLPHETRAKFCASDVMLMPAPGKGLAAGSSVRNVLHLAGVTDVSAKILSRSKNKYNNAKATLLALKDFSS